MKLAPQSQVPLYKQLKDAMLEKIAAKEFVEGDRFLSEHELSEKYGVSRITVRKALAELSEEGILFKIRGKGTFVRANPPQKPLKDTINFSALCQMQGLLPGAQVLAQQMQPANADARAFFSLPEGSYVVVLRRLRLANDIPVLIETNFFHPAMSFLLGEDFSGSLYEVLARPNAKPEKGTNTIGIAYATEEEAGHLCIAPNTALLLAHSKVYDGQGKPLHIGKQIVRVDSGIYQYYV